MRELLAAVLPRLEGIEGRVQVVFLRKGELLVLSARALEAAFELLTGGTRLEGARLSIDETAARVRCPACGYAGAAQRLTEEGFHLAIPILSCPTCGKPVEVTAGRELVVDRVEVLIPEGASPAGGSQGGDGS